jgi:hypothetical protein
MSQKLHSEPVFALTSSRKSSSNGLHIVSGGGDSLLRRTSVLQAEGCSMVELDRVELQHPGWWGDAFIWNSLIWFDGAAGTSTARYRLDGRLLATAHWDYTVRLFDRKHLKPLAVLRYVLKQPLVRGLQLIGEVVVL